MTQVEAAKRQRGGRVARWCSRALLVVGGTIAGTAAACAISTASASAAEGAPADTGSAGSTPATISVEDAPDTDRLAPVTNSAVEGLNDATQGCADLIGDASGAVTHAAAHAIRPGRGAGEDAEYGGSADGVGGADGAQAGAGQQPAGEDTDRQQEAGQDPAEHAAPDQGAGDRATSKTREHRSHRPVHRFVDQETADRVSNTVRDFTNDAVYEPIRKTAGSVEHMMRKPQDTPQVIEHNLAPERKLHDFGKSMWHALHPHSDDTDRSNTPQRPSDQDGEASGKQRTIDDAGVGDAPPAVLAAPLPPDPAPAAADDGQNQPKPHTALGATQDQDHTKHADENEQAPLPTAPVGVPMAPATGPVGPGGHLDGLLFGVVAGRANAIDPGVLGTVRCASGYLPTEPGSAPGVTPD